MSAFLLDWHDGCLTYPRVLASSACLLVLPFDESGVIKVTREQMQNLCKLIVHYNLHKGYSNTVMRDEGQPAVNCHAYVYKVLFNDEIRHCLLLC